MLSLATAAYADGEKLKQYGPNEEQAAAPIAAPIAVRWPYGRSTTGIDVHIQDLEKMFVDAPDTRIREQPVKIGMTTVGHWRRGVMDAVPARDPDGVVAAAGEHRAAAHRRERRRRAAFHDALRGG